MSTVKLLDNEGEITVELEVALRHIFEKYSADGIMTREKIREWSKDTNGEPLSEDSIDEIVEFMDVDDASNLTFKGFMQIYQLQTENNPEETISDLSKHGFNGPLQK